MKKEMNKEIVTLFVELEANGDGLGLVIAQRTVDVIGVGKGIHFDFFIGVDLRPVLGIAVKISTDLARGHVAQIFGQGAVLVNTAVADVIPVAEVDRGKCALGGGHVDLVDQEGVLAGIEQLELIVPDSAVADVACRGALIRLKIILQKHLARGSGRDQQNVLSISGKHATGQKHAKSQYA